MTSVLNVDTIADKAGTGPVALTKQAAAKVFCQTNQRDFAAQAGNSLNISSVSDGGAGDIVHAFTNNFGGALTYSIVSTCGGGSNDSAPRFAGPADSTDPTTGGFTFKNANSSGTAQDKVMNCVACFGDLA